MLYSLIWVDKLAWATERPTSNRTMVECLWTLAYFACRAQLSHVINGLVVWVGITEAMAHHCACPEALRDLPTVRKIEYGCTAHLFVI